MTGGPVCRPYGMTEAFMYSVGADDSAARLSEGNRREGPPLPYVPSEGPTYLAGIRQSRPTGRLYFKKGIIRGSATVPPQ